MLPRLTYSKNIGVECRGKRGVGSCGVNDSVSGRQGQGSYVGMEKFVCLWKIRRQYRQESGKYWKRMVREEGHEKEGGIVFMNPEQMSVICPG
jgi:hypothetical protein